MHTGKLERTKFCVNYTLVVVLLRVCMFVPSNRLQIVDLWTSLVSLAYHEREKVLAQRKSIAFALLQYYVGSSHLASQSC